MMFRTIMQTIQLASILDARLLIELGGVVFAVGVVFQRLRSLETHVADKFNAIVTQRTEDVRHFDRELTRVEAAGQVHESKIEEQIENLRVLIERLLTEQARQGALCGALRCEFGGILKERTPK